MQSEPASVRTAGQAQQTSPAGQSDCSGSIRRLPRAMAGSRPHSCRYLRALRAAEMLAWEASGGDVLLAAPGTGIRPPFPGISAGARNLF